MGIYGCMYAKPAGTTPGGCGFASESHCGTCGELPDRIVLNWAVRAVLRVPCSRQMQRNIVTNLRRLIGGSRGIRQVPQKTPLFFSPPRIPLVDRLHHPSSIIDSYNILRGKEKKMPQLLSNNYNSFNTTYINPTVADDRPDILAWLSPLDPKLRHQSIRDRRVENVGEWLLQTEEFKSWCAGSEDGKSGNAVLFCYGNPGVGKTFIR